MKNYKAFTFQIGGFTLIELVIVIGVIAISLPIIFGLFFINLQAQSKISILQEVKRNGDNALSVMEKLIRQYGKSLHSASPPSDANEVCKTGGSSYSSGALYIKDQFGSWFRFYLSSDKVASASSTPPGVSTNLTNDKVKISQIGPLAGPTPFIRCNRPGTFSPPIISVSFNVLQASTTTRHEEKASMNYQTKIKLRSY